MLRRTKPELIRNPDLIVETNYRNFGSYYDVESFDESLIEIDKFKRRRNLVKSFPKRIIFYIIGIIITYYLIKSIYNGIFASQALPKSEIIGAPTEILKQYDDFFRWINKNGAKISKKLRMAWYGPDMGVGVMTMQDINVDEKLIQIPQNIIFSIRNNNIAAKNLLNLIPMDLDIDEVILTSFALLIEKMTQNSFFEPFIKTFRFPMNPMYWSESDLDLLDNPFLASQNRTLVDNKIGDWIKLRNFFENRHPDVYHRIKRIAMKDMVWAINIILQRSLLVNNEIALVPYLDSINNALLWNPETMKYEDINRFTIEHENGITYLSFSSFAMYRTGDQLALSYSLNKPSTDYFFAYGFVTENNKNNFIVLRAVPIDRSELRKQILDELNDETLYYLSESNGGLSDSFLRAVYVSLANIDELEEFEGTLELRHKRLAKNWVLKSLIAETEAWETKLEEDLKIAKNKHQMNGMTSQQRNAFMLRIDLKQFMYKLIYMISPNKSRKFVNDLRKESFIPSYDIQIRRYK